MGGTRDINQFFKDNALYLAIGVAALILIVLLIIFLSMKGKKKEKKPKREISLSAYMDAFGGTENIISHELKGSRIVVKLHDYSLLDKEKLKGAGVDSFILMSNQITLVIAGDAAKVYAVIFPENERA